MHKNYKTSLNFKDIDFFIHAGRFQEAVLRLLSEESAHSLLPYGKTDEDEAIYWKDSLEFHRVMLYTNRAGNALDLMHELLMFTMRFRGKGVDALELAGLIFYQSARIFPMREAKKGKEQKND